VLAFGDLGCAAVVSFAGEGLDADRRAKLSRLSDAERAQIRPLIEQSLDVWGRWLSMTPEGCAYAACGVYGFALWTRFRTVQAIERAARRVEPERSQEPESGPAKMNGHGPTPEETRAAREMERRSMPGGPLQ
jgi:hypothetical protein